MTGKPCMNKTSHFSFYKNCRKVGTDDTDSPSNWCHGDDLSKFSKCGFSFCPNGFAYQQNYNANFSWYRSVAFTTGWIFHFPQLFNIFHNATMVHQLGTKGYGGNNCNSCFQQLKNGDFFMPKKNLGAVTWPGVQQMCF